MAIVILRYNFLQESTQRNANSNHFNSYLTIKDAILLTSWLELQGAANQEMSNLNICCVLEIHSWPNKLNIESKFQSVYCVKYDHLVPQTNQQNLGLSQD